MDSTTFLLLSRACEHIRSGWYVDLDKAAAAILSGEAARLIEIEEKLAEYRKSDP